MCAPERVARAAPAPSPPQALVTLVNSEEIATFACKITNFRGPPDTRHSESSEALRFHLTGEISAHASAQAIPDRIQVQYVHRISAFVVTCPIDYMECIKFGHTIFFVPEATPGSPSIDYSLTYNTYTLTEKFTRTDRQGKIRATNINPNLEVVRAALTSTFEKGSYEIERVWNYMSPAGLTTMDFGFSFHDTYSKPDLRMGYQAGLNKPLHILNQQFKINNVKQSFSIDPVYCARTKICKQCLEPNEQARCSCDGKARSATAGTSGIARTAARAALQERLKRKYGL